MFGRNKVTIADMVGKIFVTVRQSTKYGEDTLEFITHSGKGYRFYHSQSCCEHVYIEDINGDLSDLEGVPLLVAEEVSGDMPYDPDYEEWTFYKFRTIKGSVDVRWFGTSNGYYSTSVQFEEID